MQKCYIIPFLGCSVEKNSECATNEMRLPGSPPTANNSGIFLTSKEKIVKFCFTSQFAITFKIFIKTEVIVKYLFK